MPDEQLVIRVHALKRMAQRGIAEPDIRHVIETGETIERYPKDKPYPSRLILGRHEERPPHVLVAENKIDRNRIVITVYEPDPEKWETDLRTRKPQ